MWKHTETARANIYGAVGKSEEGKRSKFNVVLFIFLDVDDGGDILILVVAGHEVQDRFILGLSLFHQFSIVKTSNCTFVCLFVSLFVCLLYWTANFSLNVITVL